MADSDSGSEFGDLINQLIRDRDEGFGDDDQSDLSVLSVHTSDLSDFDEFEDNDSLDELSSNDEHPNF